MADGTLIDGKRSLYGHARPGWGSRFMEWVVGEERASIILSMSRSMIRSGDIASQG